MFNDGWFDDDLAVEVAQHPFGPSFGAVHRDDAEVFRSDLANQVLDLACWLSNESSFGNFGRTLFRACDHLRVSNGKAEAKLPLECAAGPFSFFLNDLRTYQGSGCVGVSRRKVANERVVRGKT